MIVVINIIITILGIYLLIGLLFGIYFLFLGATKIDALMQETKKRVRLLLLPGIIATWPFFAMQLITKVD